jgi:hypothetical protein
MIIHLTHGKTTEIDDSDAALLPETKWQAVERKGLWYAVTRWKRADGKWTMIYLHVLILGKRPGSFIDHRNGNGLDNRRENLRHVTHCQNLANSPSRPDSSSRYKGVTFDKKTGRWQAQIAVENKRRWLGRYDTELEAAMAYDLAAREFQGEYARPNIPQACMAA